MTDTTSAYPDTRLLIAGEWRDASGGKTIAVANPATGQTIGHGHHVFRVQSHRLSAKRDREGRTIIFGR